MSSGSPFYIKDPVAVRAPTKIVMVNVDIVTVVTAVGADVWPKLVPSKTRWTNH